MKIKKCSDFIFENVKNFDYLYHSVSDERYINVMKNGLQGEIYLTKTPDEALIYNDIILEIDVKDRDIKIKDDGYVVDGVTPDKIKFYKHG